MWIRRLKVADCAGIADASVDLKPGLNVLHGPNELGKSSLAEAVRAVLLVQSGSSAARVLDDWHSDAPPTVALTFEQEAQKVWQVRKTFRIGGSESYLSFSRDGRDFSTDSRGREVDGRLNEMLGWGARTPGGKGGPRGMPTTLITTALLGRQDDVVAILDGSLADDPTESGREQLMRALEGLAEDPRLKKLLGAVQEKVDEAYTATGRRRSGRGSPWTQLKEDRLQAEELQQEARSQKEESEGVRRRVNELQQEQTEAQAVRDKARRDLEEAQETATRRGELEKAREAFRSADEQVTRIETLIRTLDVKRAATEATRGKIAELSAEHTDLERTVVRSVEQLAEAQERLREIEAGGGEHERRLREQKAENARLRIVREQEGFNRQIEDAEQFAELDRRVGELDGRIEEKEVNLAEACELMEEAAREVLSDQRQLQELRLERLSARYLTARDDLKRRAGEHEEAQEHARATAAAEDEAASLRRAAADLRAPNSEETESLNKLETDRRIAREKLAVGLVLDLELQAGAMAEVRADGETQALRSRRGGTRTWRPGVNCESTSRALAWCMFAAAARRSQRQPKPPSGSSRLFGGRCWSGRASVLWRNSRSFCGRPSPCAVRPRNGAGARLRLGCGRRVWRRWNVRRRSREASWTAAGWLSPRCSGRAPRWRSTSVAWMLSPEKSWRSSLKLRAWNAVSPSVGT